MISIEHIGMISAMLTTGAFVPQVWKIVRTKDTTSISLGMYIIFTLGVIGWLTYGLALNERPIIFANCVTLVLSLIILGYKLRYK